MMFRLLLSLLGCSAGEAPESAFWRWFVANDQRLFEFERDQERVFDALTSELGKVDPALTFEFGPMQAGRREFVVSADGIRAAFPAVEQLCAAAPSMARWTVVKFRPRRAPADVEYGGVRVSAATLRVRVSREADKVGLVVFIPGHSPATAASYNAIGYLLLDQALGEFDVETHVGPIEVTGAEQMTPLDSVSLAELPAAFDAILARH